MYEGLGFRVLGLHVLQHILGQRSPGSGHMESHTTL